MSTDQVPGAANPTTGFAIVLGQPVEGNAVVPIRWCLSKVGAKALAAFKVLDPYVLIIVWNETRRRERRYLAKLGEPMRLVEMTGPGRNTVYATIVWKDPGSDKEVHDRFLSRDGSGYQTTVLNSKKQLDTSKLRCTFGADTSEVVVPEKYFAHEPAAWERAWVNRWFRTKPVDQCAFRKRRILAYSFQPIAVLVCMLSKMLAGGPTALFMQWGRGWKGVSWKPVVMPWRHPFREIWQNHKSSIFFDHFYLIPFSLITLLIEGFIAFVIQTSGKVNHFWPLMGWVKYFLFFTLALYALMGLIGVFWAVTGSIGWVRRWIEKQAEKDAEAARARLAAMADPYADLYCTANLEASLDALPPGKKTLYLRFQALKAQVCRPYD